MKFFFGLAIGKQWDIVIEEFLYQSFVQTKPSSWRRKTHTILCPETILYDPVARRLLARGYPREALISRKLKLFLREVLYFCFLWAQARSALQLQPLLSHWL